VVTGVVVDLACVVRGIPAPATQEAWKERRSTIWHLMHRSRPGPHYASLKAELDALAASLARSTDTRQRGWPSHPRSRQQRLEPPSTAGDH
jgi:hypothetical protein